MLRLFGDHMNNKSASIVQRFWSFCDILRDDGVSY
jgi:hypothetical protein